MKCATFKNEQCKGKICQSDRHFTANVVVNGNRSIAVVNNQNLASLCPSFEVHACRCTSSVTRKQEIEKKRAHRVFVWTWKERSSSNKSITDNVSNEQYKLQPTSWSMLIYGLSSKQKVSFSKSLCSWVSEWRSKDTHRSPMINRSNYAIHHYTGDDYESVSKLHKTILCSWKRKSGWWRWWRSAVSQSVLVSHYPPPPTTPTTTTITFLTPSLIVN